jgi:hypothetical protein
VKSLFVRGAVAALLGAAAAAYALAGSAPDQPLPCENAQQGWEFATLVCRVDAAPAPRKLRITVTFAGVHDDSSAALVASEGDQAIDCGKAGKTRIEGEEGGDTLVCPFTLAAKPGTRQITVNLIWHHADPASFALRAD